ncbi:DUF1980 domain-containing protein [Paenibacillaceae bacterium WGS1546]|uniref:DUF1980 domain-containing protein n=1 Tax=Cohnella sp. WGS1546 TaxID=3366810 RepID=UPI00372D2FA1
MNRARRLAAAANYAARAAVLAGFALYVVRLSRAGLLELYVEPQMIVLVKWTAIGLLAVSAQQLLSAFRSAAEPAAGNHSCGCAHDHGHDHGHDHSHEHDHSHDHPDTWRKALLLYGWFAVPLAIAWAVPEPPPHGAYSHSEGVHFAPATPPGNAARLPADAR